MLLGVWCAEQSGGRKTRRQEGGGLRPATAPTAAAGPEQHSRTRLSVVAAAVVALVFGLAVVAANVSPNSTRLSR